MELLLRLFGLVWGLFMVDLGLIYMMFIKVQKSREKQGEAGRSREAEKLGTRTPNKNSRKKVPPGIWRA